jgi:hypothetical protein
VIADAVTSAGLVLLGAIVGFVPQYVLAAQAERREQRLELWRRDADLCWRLEDLAGEITHRLNGFAMRPEDYDALAPKIVALGLLAGKFPRHPKIQRCIRDLHNTVSRIWADRGRYDAQAERQAAMTELNERQDVLLAACGHAVGRDGRQAQPTEKAPATRGGHT